jgi:hypothetical protein
LAIGESLGSVAEVTQWRDGIPLQYEYTAGVAGEKFLRGLMSGKILAGFCPACKERSLPARIYCVRCYGAITKYVKVGPVGKVKAITRGREGGGSPTAFVYVTFDGVRGGMIHRLLGKGRVGSQVVPRFRPKAQRTGSILDIQGFELKE